MHPVHTYATNCGVARVSPVYSMQRNARFKTRFAREIERVLTQATQEVANDVAGICHVTCHCYKKRNSVPTFVTFVSHTYGS